MVRCAEAFFGSDSILAHLKNTCVQRGLPEVTNLSFPTVLDREDIRRALGSAAKMKSWFKDIGRAEMMAEIIGDCFDAIASTPLATDINRLRQWTDGQ